MIEKTVNNLQEFDEDFEIVEKTFEDVISEIDFKTEDEKLLCGSIVDHIEKSIASGLKDMKIVQVPYIGTLRIDPVKKQIKENKDAFHIARHNMNKNEYKDYVKNYINDLREEQESIDAEKLKFKRLRSINKTKYEVLYKSLGKEYAEMFIYAISILTYVPYDKEWEEHYQSLKD